MKFIVWKDQMYSPIRDSVEETDGNVFFHHDVNGEKCVADGADILYIAQSEQDAKRFLLRLILRRIQVLTVCT